VTELRNVAADQILTITEPNLQPIGSSPGGFQLRLLGRIGSCYDLYTCPGLGDPAGWQSWLSVTNTSPATIITDTSASAASRRFYRSVQR
jgi:hypothetical protein